MATNQVITGKFDYAFLVNLECKGKKSVLQWCIGMNLLAKEHECPTCKLPMVLAENNDEQDGYAWICHQGGKSDHSVKRSVRKGSFFERSTLSLTSVLLMIYLWIKQATYKFIEDELDISSATVLEWITFCQEVCVEICINRSGPIGGEDCIIEICECKFKKKTFLKNNETGVKWVYIGFEKETDKGFYAVVEKRSEETLSKVIEKYVRPGSILVSDLWKEYDCLTCESFVNLKENFGLKFEDLGVGVYGSSIIGMRRHIKRTCNDARRFNSETHLYYAEYMFRRTNSDISYDIIRSFLKEITEIYSQSNKDM